MTLYEPEELVLSARAGTPIAEIEALVAGKGQELAFEPMDYGPVLGGPAASGSLGGVLAANLAGPRRIKAGAARDHFLGFSAVSGRGETFKSGGRVVKNVTGYDLCKVLAGSYGTLAAMTDVTIKVLPKAETEATLMVLGLDDAAAMRAMAQAMGSSCDVSGAAHLPLAAAVRLTNAGKPVTAFRLEGFAPSVAHRKQALEALMLPLGTLVARDQEGSREFWRGVRDVMPFAADTASGERPLWRISTAPTKGAQLAAAIAAQADAELFYDWAGGLIWLALAAERRCGRGAGTACCCRRRRPCDAGPRAGCGACRGRCVRAAGGGSRRAQQAGEGKLRSQGRAQSRAYVGGGVNNRDANLLHPRAARRSADRGIRKDPARLRALRLLHRDLPDLCAAGR